MRFRQRSWSVVLGDRRSSGCQGLLRTARTSSRQTVTSSRCSPNPVVTYAGGVRGTAGDQAGEGEEDRPLVGQRHEVRRLSPRRRHVDAAEPGRGWQKLYDYVYSLERRSPPKLTDNEARGDAHDEERRWRSRRTTLQTIETSSTPAVPRPRRQGRALGPARRRLQGRSEQGRRRGRSSSVISTRRLAREHSRSQTAGRRRRAATTGPAHGHGLQRDLPDRRRGDRVELQRRGHLARHFNAAQGGNDGNRRATADNGSSPPARRQRSRYTNGRRPPAATSERRPTGTRPPHSRR